MSNAATDGARSEPPSITGAEFEARHRRPCGGRRRGLDRRLRRPRARGEPHLPDATWTPGSRRRCWSSGRQADADPRQGGRRLRADRADRGRCHLLSDVQSDGDRPRRRADSGNGAARDRLSDGDRIGVAGWKALGADEFNGRRPAIFAPAFFVDTLRDLAGESGSVFDITPALTSPRSGLRAFASADQIAIFEWGAPGARRGLTRSRAPPGRAPPSTTRSAPPTGGRAAQPAPGVRCGRRRRRRPAEPASRTLELGDAAVTCIGLWGGNCARGGLIAALDRRSHRGQRWLPRTARVPYWRAIATWYETLAVGVAGGEVFATIRSSWPARVRLVAEPGHLIHYEEWMDSPIRAGSDDPIASGMVLQSDIIPTGIRPGWTVNCEDTIAIADERCAMSSGGAIPNCGRGSGRGRTRARHARCAAPRRGAAAVVHGRVFQAVLARRRQRTRVCLGAALARRRHGARVGRVQSASRTGLRSSPMPSNPDRHHWPAASVT